MIILLVAFVLFCLWVIDFILESDAVKKVVPAWYNLVVSAFLALSILLVFPSVGINLIDDEFFKFIPFLFFAACLILYRRYIKRELIKRKFIQWDFLYLNSTAISVVIIGATLLFTYNSKINGYISFSESGFNFSIVALVLVRFLFCFNKFKLFKRFNAE